MLKSLLLNSALLFGATYAACHVDVSVVSKGLQLGNPLFGLTLKNDGTCPITKVVLDIDLLKNGCVLQAGVGLTLNPDLSVTVGGFTEIGVDASISSATFVAVCLDKGDILHPSVTVKEVLCDQNHCSAPPTTKAPTTKAPTTKAPTTKAPTTKAPTTKAPTTKPPTTQPPATQAPTSAPCVYCPTAAREAIAISFSSFNGTFGVTADSGGAGEAIAFANQGCMGYQGSSYQCGPVLVVEDQCGSIAISSKITSDYPVNNYAAGVGAGNTPAEAEAKALANCQCLISGISGATCTLKATSCPTPTCAPTPAPTTKAPTTTAPTTKAPTTKAPTTKAPTTKAPTTKAPTTKAPTTAAPKTCKVTPSIVSAKIGAVLDPITGKYSETYKIAAVNVGTCIAADVSVKIDLSSGCVIASTTLLTELAANVYLLNGFAQLAVGAHVDLSTFTVVCLTPNPTVAVEIYGVHCPNC